MNYILCKQIPILLLILVLGAVGCDANTRTSQVTATPTPIPLPSVPPASSTPHATATRVIPLSPSPRATLSATATIALIATHTPAAMLNTFQLLDAAVASGEITLDDAALYKMYYLFGNNQSLVPEKYLSQVPLTGDAMGMFASILVDWDKLKPDTQAKLAQFLTPQVVPGTTQQAIPTRPPNQLPPGQIKLEGVILEVIDNKTLRINTNQYDVIHIQETANSLIELYGKPAHVSDLKYQDRFEGTALVHPDATIEILTLDVNYRVITVTPSP